MKAESNSGRQTEGQSAESKLRPGARLWISGENKILGPGAVKLLTLIKETGSLKHACETMDLSYSKGRKIVAKLEHELKCDVVVKQQGGKSGGGTTLTEAGTSLVDRYEAFSSECAVLIQASFDKHFDGFLDR